MTIKTLSAEELSTSVNTDQKTLELRAKDRQLKNQGSDEEGDFEIFSVNPIQWEGDPLGNFPRDALWDFQTLKVPYLWSNFGARGQGVNVAVIDSGVDPHHQALLGKKLEVKSFLPGNEDPSDKTGHGTWVATKIGGAGVGIAPKCNLTCLRVLDDSGAGSSTFSTSALEWLTKKEDVHVVNMSLGGTKKSIDQEKAIWNLYKKGVIVIAASGNQDSGEAFYPAAFEGLLSVGAVEKNGNRAFFSNYGAHLDLVAPGVACYAGYLDRTYRAMRGTSMAAPIVAGLATLGVSLVKRLMPSVKGPELRDLIWNTLVESVDDLGPEGKDVWYGFGGINGPRFMELLYRKLKHTS